MLIVIPYNDFLSTAIGSRLSAIRLPEEMTFWTTADG